MLQCINIDKSLYPFFLVRLAANHLQHSEYGFSMMKSRHSRYLQSNGKQQNFSIVCFVLHHTDNQHIINKSFHSKHIRKDSTVHFIDSLVRMPLEVSFCYFYRRMSHGVADQFGLIVPIVGYRGPAVTGSITAQGADIPQQAGHLAQAIVESTQRVLVLPVLVLPRM